MVRASFFILNDELPINISEQFMSTDNTCLVYRDHYFQKAKENMKYVKTAYV